MLIRSQDKKLLIPLEKFTIGITKDNCICATSNICVSPAEFSAGWLGKYSTEEKALKVLDMIESAYYNLEYSKFLGCENDTFASCVFQMPQDEEIEE